ANKQLQLTTETPAKLTIAALPNAQPPNAQPVSEKDWRDLRYRFEQLLNGGLMAYWSKTPEGADRWTVMNGTKEANYECQSLCAHGGAMLLRSAKVHSDLPSEIASKADHMDRWLSFVRFKYGFRRGGITELSGVVGSFESGVIEDLARSSVTACTDSSTREM